MFFLRRWQLILLFTLCTPLRALADPETAQTPPPSNPVTFSLESTAGGQTSLASFRGRVVVIFYEDREHTSDNTELKGMLTQYTRDNRLGAQLSIVPVANVSSYDFHPASDFARAAIRTVASEIGLSVLMDWAGTLERAPFSLASSASNVVVIDRTGRIVFRHAGVVTGPARTAFFRAVRRAIRVVAALNTQ